MIPNDVWKAWAPSLSPWSAWIKPALVVYGSDWPRFADLADESFAPPLPSFPWFASGDATDIKAEAALACAAVVIDLPGEEAVGAGLWLAETRGYRPIPLFNGCPSKNAVVYTLGIRRALVSCASRLTRLPLAGDAPPAFLLDRNRLPSRPALLPGQFDNRWMVFTQDFPSADFLREHGIAHVLLIQPEDKSALQDDLVHILRRWQEAGLTLNGTALKPGGSFEPRPLHVPVASLFREYWQRTMLWLSLTRHSTGSFGAPVPPYSSG